MINKRWIVNTPSDEEKTLINELSSNLKISETLCSLLVQRGINTYEAALKFFRPDLNDLHDPFLMNDMDKAVARLDKALGRKEKIMVYGDYDVDGTSSVALVYSVLRKYTSNIGYYIPDRYAEGYGVSYKGIDYAHENGYTLMISLDCGIKAVEKVKYATELGIDFIICDHHTPGDTLPDAVAVLDPKREDSTYPYKHLSGCGVGFKLLQAFAISNDIPFDELKQHLDLVAVSIASDIVPITGENRILAYYGIRKLNHSPCIGLRTIVDSAGLKDREITISDIVFKIGPRINASGRIETGNEAVELLVANDIDAAQAKCDEINEYNQKRKDLDKTITDEAIAIIENNPALQEKKSTVLYNPDWHKGVIGIVASRLIERYYRPTVILTKSNGFATGSARSVAGFDLYSAIESCKDLLENFGGHMYAAGLTLREENIDKFIQRFEDFVSENITYIQSIPQISIDAEIAFAEITPRFYSVLERFRPYGPENMRPVFMTSKVRDAGGSRLVGKENGHQKLDLLDFSVNYPISGIAFSLPDFNGHLKQNTELDVVYSIEENNFNNKTTLQIQVKDLRIHGEA